MIFPESLLNGKFILVLTSYQIPTPFKFLIIRCLWLKWKSWRLNSKTYYTKASLDLVFLHGVQRFYFRRRRMGPLEYALIIANLIKSLLITRILSLGLTTCLINSKRQATFLRLTQERGISNLGWEVKIYQKWHFKLDMVTTSSCNVLWSH